MESRDLQILMDPVHDAVPEYFAVAVIDSAVREHGVIVISAPDPAGIIGRVADKPGVFVTGSGA